MREARGERPLLFAGGHEHSLQVIRHDSATAPHYTVVAGSASKLTGVGHTRGMLFRASAPGYARVVSRTSGAVDLYIVAAPPDHITCPDEAFGTDDISPEAERCLREGGRAYETVFSVRLKEPGPDSVGPIADHLLSWEAPSNPLPR